MEAHPPPALKRKSKVVAPPGKALYMIGYTAGLERLT
jgi:hypothetical protein